MLRTCTFVALAFTLLIGSVGCSETKTFTVVFANRLSAGHDIDCYMNGNRLGSVVSGATGKFSVDTRRSATPTSPSSPEHSEANVVFTARDLSTGVLSRAISATVSTDQTTYVDIDAGVF